MHEEWGMAHQQVFHVEHLLGCHRFFSRE